MIYQVIFERKIEFRSSLSFLYFLCICCFVFLWALLPKLNIRMNGKCFCHSDNSCFLPYVRSLASSSFSKIVLQRTGHIVFTFQTLIFHKVFGVVGSLMILNFKFPRKYATERFFKLVNIGWRYARYSFSPHGILFGPGRRVPKRYSSCSSCSCCRCYQFSKMPKALLIRSAAQRNFAHTFMLIFLQIYCLRFLH